MSRKPRNDIVNIKMVTDRIIEQLENGMIPWKRPWTGVRSGAFNRISKKPYSLLNPMILLYQSEYATFKQWKDLVGHVHKGEKSEIVVFWKLFQTEEKNEDGTKENDPSPVVWTRQTTGEGSFYIFRIVLRGDDSCVLKEGTFFVYDGESPFLMYRGA